MLALPLAARAAVTLPAVVSDGMVLQRDAAAPLWGSAAPGEAVTASLGAARATATADAAGQWSLTLNTAGLAGPLTLTVNDRTVRNVRVGEVWHASGQSNMRYPLSRASTAGDIASAGDPDLRYFLNGQWHVASTKTAGQFSAAAYYFAEELRQRQRVPVGILDTSVPGAVIQGFISPDAFARAPELLKVLEPHLEAPQKPSELWDHPPGIGGVIRYGARGVLWYQGEGNRDFPVTYARLFPALIGDWRRQSGQELPFLFVQLANWRPKSAAYKDAKDAALREAQFKTLSVPKTAMVVTIDLGIAEDVHYPNKKPVGERLALAARATVYGEPIEYSGPLFASAVFEGGRAVVSFTHADDLRSAGGPLTGFVLAGEDRAWVRADAKVVGGTVVVTSPRVPRPTMVRYGFELNPDCNLTNAAGLPASPFRSDSIVNFATQDGE